jgi:NADPH2:quinone reductase
VGAIWNGIPCSAAPGESAPFRDPFGARRKWRCRHRSASNRTCNGPARYWHCRDQKGVELVKREGAHRAFNHRNAGYQDEILEGTANRGADIILEMLANVNLSSDTKLLAKNGRVIVIGSRGEVTINPRELMSRRASIRGFTLWAITPGEEAEIHAALFAGLENGTLCPIVGKELPLADAARAHKEILEPGSAGKMVLVC